MIDAQRKKAVNAMKKCDVLVMGAGPAGLAAAIHARQCGLSCVVVDRNPETYAKPCGDGLTKFAVAALERLEISKEELLLQGANDIARSIHQFPERTVVFSHPEHSTFTLPRIQLLKLMRNRAKELGAELRYNCATDIQRTEDGRYCIGNVCGANIINAAGSQTNPWIHPRVKESLPLGYSAIIHAKKTKLKENELVFIHSRCSDEGYCWAFPLGGSKWNIGIWQAREKENLAKNFKDFEEYWIKDAFEEAMYITPLRGATLGVCFGRTECGQDSEMLFCGDAAGSCERKNGEGISSAIDSGRLAVDLIWKKSSQSAVCDDLVQCASICPQSLRAVSPIYIGRSGDTKYHIQTDEGSFYCRSEPTAGKRKTIAALSELVSIPNIVLPEKVKVSSDGSRLCTRYPWIQGMNLEDYMRFNDLDHQRKMGVMAGRILKQLHLVNIEKYQQYRYDYLSEYSRLKQYIQSNEAEFPHYSEVCAFVDRNMALVSKRPIALTLQDVRPENIIVGDDGQIYFVDILGARLADPWSDFIKCTVLSPDFTVPFASAMLDEYFGGSKRPHDFHRVLALYSGFALLKYAAEKFKTRGKLVVQQANRVYAYILNVL